MSTITWSFIHQEMVAINMKKKNKEKLIRFDTDTSMNWHKWNVIMTHWKFLSIVLACVQMPVKVLNRATVTGFWWSSLKIFCSILQSSQYHTTSVIKYHNICLTACAFSQQTSVDALVLKILLIKLTAGTMKMLKKSASSRHTNEN